MHQGQSAGAMIATTRQLLASALAVLLAACAAGHGASLVSAPDETSPAAAGLIDASDPKTIVRLLRQRGYAADLNVDQSGAVEIRTSHDSPNFWLFFEACAPDFTQCEVITLAAGFDFDAPQVPGLLGNWNEERFSKAYLDSEGDPFVEFTINMLHGVSPENFIDTLDWFGREITEFIDQIGWHVEDVEPARPV